MHGITPPRERTMEKEMGSMTYRFRAVWPVVDNVPTISLLTQAGGDIRHLAAQAHARIVGPGRFSFARAVDVPGSGRVTEWVLLFEAPAERVAVRPYRKPKVAA